MGDVGELLLTVCGLSVGCCGSLVLVFFLVSQTGFARMLPAFSMFNAFFPNKEKNADEEVEYRRKRRRGDLSGSAKPKRQSTNLDFDSAVARHRDGPKRGKPGRRSSSSSLDRSEAAFDDDFDTDSHRGLRSNPNRPRRDIRRGGRDSSDDEAFGGMLDDDGDGYSDF